MDRPDVDYTSSPAVTGYTSDAATREPSARKRSPQGAELSGSGKRIRLEQPEVIYNPALLNKGGNWFIPEDLDQRGGLVAPLTPEMRQSINHYQVRHLKAGQSRVHNQGVFLSDREPSARAVKKNQVVAVYEGTPFRSRLLTAGEQVTAGLEEPGLAAENPPLKQLVWFETGDTPTFLERPPGFQAFDEALFYYDGEGRRVWLGIDALDSDLPISNINFIKWDNISLRPCIDASLIHSVNEEDIEISPPPPGSFSLIAVANKTIDPGTELFIKFHGKNYPTKKPHFWGPDQYFFPFLSPKPVHLHASENGITVRVEAAEGNSNPGPGRIREIIETAIEQGKSLTQTVSVLNNRHVNPLTGTLYWTHGCVQLLCQLLNYEHFRGYRYLTFLCHCRDAEGTLDNNAINYLAGFIREQAPSVTPPAIRVRTIEDVIEWLQGAIEEIGQLPETETTQKERKYLENELQLLEVWKWRTLDSQNSPVSGQEKELRRTQQIAKVRSFVLQEQAKMSLQETETNGSPGHKERKYVCPPEKLTSHYLLPHELWPDKLSSSVWRHAHLRCMPLFCPDMPAPDQPPGPLDILTCFHPRTPEYRQALRDILSQKQQEGTTPDSLRNRMNPDGFSQRNSPGGSWDRITEDYLIPHIPEIPEALWSTAQWQQLTSAQWQSLGYDPDAVTPLKSTVERLLPAEGVENAERVLDSARRSLCDHWADVWQNDPDIKQAIKDARPTSQALLNHLIHISEADIRPEYRHWQPCDSMQVCRAGSDRYNEAMELFLKEQLEHRKNAHEIALHLNALARKSTLSRDKKGAMAVELPACISHHGSWTGASVAELIRINNLTVPDEFELLPEHTVSLKDVIQERINASNSGREQTYYLMMKGLAKKYPEAIIALAQELHLDPDKIRAGKGASCRIIYNHLGIKLPGRGNLQEALKVKPLDRISSVLPEHPDWASDVLSLIARLRQRGYSMKDTAYHLSNGDRSAHTCGLLFGPIALPAGTPETEWSETLLTRFMQQHGAELF